MFHFARGVGTTGQRRRQQQGVGTIYYIATVEAGLASRPSRLECVSSQLKKKTMLPWSRRLLAMNFSSWSSSIYKKRNAQCRWLVRRECGLRYMQALLAREPSSPTSIFTMSKDTT